MRKFLVLAFVGVVSLVLGSCGQDTITTTVVVHSVSISAPKLRSPVEVRVVLSASRETTVWLELGYSVADSNTWYKCSIVRGVGLWGVEVSESPHEFVLVWDADADLPEGTFNVQLGVLQNAKIVARSQQFEVVTNDLPPMLELVSAIPEVVDQDTVFEIVAHDDHDEQLIVRAHVSIDSDSFALPLIDASGKIKKEVLVPTDEARRVRLWLGGLAVGQYRNVHLGLYPSDALGSGRGIELLRDLNVPVEDSLECLPPNGIQRGIVEVPCVLRSNGGSYFRLEGYYRDPLKPESDWIPAVITPMPMLAATPAGTPVVVEWLSAEDLPFYAADGVEFEVRAQPKGLRSRVKFALNNAPAIDFAALSEVFLGDDQTPMFIEIYGAPGSSLEGYALLEVRRDGQYDRTRQRGYLLFDESAVIPDDGFLVIAAQEAQWADLVDERLSTFFRFGFPTNLLIIKPLKKPEFYIPDKTPLVDAVGFGEFSAADVFAGRCEFTKHQAEQQGEQLEVCPPSASAPAPQTGKSACRAVSNLNLGENRLDWKVCSVPTPGSGYLLNPRD